METRDGPSASSEHPRPQADPSEATLGPGSLYLRLYVLRQRDGEVDHRGADFVGHFRSVGRNPWSAKKRCARVLAALVHSVTRSQAFWRA